MKIPPSIEEPFDVLDFALIGLIAEVQDSDGAHGTYLIAELQRRGWPIGENRVYRVLGNLERLGFLVSERAHEYPRKTYYRLAGRRGRSDIMEPARLTRSVLRGLI